MIVTLAIDPGIRGCGCAVFFDQQLHRAAYVKNPAENGQYVAECVSMAKVVAEWLDDVLPHLTTIHKAVFEWPRILPASRQKGSRVNVDPNDLLALSGVDCAIAAAIDFQGGELIKVFPDEWKGQLAKKVMNVRAWERLSPEEQSRVELLPRGGLQKDTMDAVGIGLFHLGRLERRRVFA